MFIAVQNSVRFPIGNFSGISFDGTYLILSPRDLTSVIVNVPNGTIAKVIDLASSSSCNSTVCGDYGGVMSQYISDLSENIYIYIPSNTTIGEYKIDFNFHFSVL